MIVLEDERRNLLKGNIVVSDKNALMKYRESLLNETYTGMDANFKKVSNHKMVSFDDCVSPGIVRHDNMLIRNYDFEADYREKNFWVYDYKNDLIVCNHLNTILLLNSLIDETDRYYKSIVGLDFSKVGIFDVNSFDETWHRCCANLLLQHNKKDLEAFRDAFVDGGLVFQVQDSWLRAELATMNVLKRYNLNLNEIASNTKVLGVDKVLKRSK